MASERPAEGFLGLDASGSVSPPSTECKLHHPHLEFPTLALLTEAQEGSFSAGDVVEIGVEDDKITVGTPKPAAMPTT